MSDQIHSIPLINEPAPAFKAITTQGEVNFPVDYKGKWVILFSHPSDFTPVCTTEFMTFQSLLPEFQKLNTEIIGLSVDSIASHIAWLRKIKDLTYKDIKNPEITFPLIEDLKMEVAKLYGMIQPSHSATSAVRAVFVVDPVGKIRAIIYYSNSTGRNINELVRLIKALQIADENAVATPANWQPGDDVLLPAPRTSENAQERMEDKDCEDWFLCFKKPEDLKRK